MYSGFLTIRPWKTSEHSFLIAINHFAAHHLDLLPLTLMRATSLLRYATPTTIPKPKSTPAAKPSRSKHLRQPPLSLEHFLLRSRVLNLYRTIVRSIYSIPDRDARRDPIAHAKGEFARNRNVTEAEQIRYLVSTGKAEWDGMRRYVEEMAIRAGK